MLLWLPAVGQPLTHLAGGVLGLLSNHRDLEAVSHNFHGGSLHV